MSAGMNEIKNRLKSVGSTMQITKAMELVATSKLRRAKAKAESSRVYYETLLSAIENLTELSELCESAWSKPNGSQKRLFIVIAGDRGLAGGYNSSIFRLARELQAEGDAVYLPIGKKALEHYRRRGCEIFLDSAESADDLTVGDALAIAERVTEAYRSGEVGGVELVYTRFASMISQIPTHKTLLPLDAEVGKQKDAGDAILGGDPEEMLDKIVPYYLGGIISAALREALASESAARRAAMNSANKNAEEMIGALMLKYNRARQAIITQEITEIISGSSEQ